MDVILRGESKEIAALVLAVQGRQDVKIAIQGAEAVTIEGFQSRCLEHLAGQCT